MSDFLTIVIILFVLFGLYFAYRIGHNSGASERDKYWEEELPDQRKDAIMKSRAVLGGQFSEQLAPFLPNFKYLPTECKFIGKPIDLIVFKGSDEKNIDEVVFVEIKSGKSKLNSHESNLKKTIENKKVRWEEYRIPEELTQKKDISEEVDKIVKDKKKL
jgi:predicted Holliday junction resolvase-like endonuclease